MFTVIYFIYLGKDCQAVFPPNQTHMLDSFITTLQAEDVVYSRIDLDEEGNPIDRKEVENV
jgi:hypothetical protein